MVKTPCNMAEEHHSLIGVSTLPSWFFVKKEGIEPSFLTVDSSHAQLKISRAGFSTFS
jgi:hypothetical protein